MTSSDTATLLDDAADRFEAISRADLQVMLRRAALQLRNAAGISMEDEWKRPCATWLASWA
jgi:hypothetical protein